MHALHSLHSPQFPLTIKTNKSIVCHYCCLLLLLLLLFFALSGSVLPRFETGSAAITGDNELKDDTSVP